MPASKRTPFLAAPLVGCGQRLVAQVGTGRRNDGRANGGCVTGIMDLGLFNQRSQPPPGSQAGQGVT